MTQTAKSPVYDPRQERDGPLPPTAWELLRRWARNITVGAMAASAGVHLLLWLWAHFIVVGGGGWGGGAGAGQVGPALETGIVSGAELATIRAEAVDVSTPSVVETSKDNSPTLAVEDPTTGGGPGEGFGEMPGVGPLTGAGDISGAGEGLGGTGGGGGASFFGVEASGSRFAYIVDVSGSMEGPRLERLKLELRRSIDGMLETSQFSIVSFSDAAMFVGGERGWMDASAAGKKGIRAHVELMRSGGGTNPVPAFQLISTLRPRPEAIYFMTDGEFGGELEVVIAQIADLTKNPRVPIHCICFGSNAGEDAMRRIARLSKGTYTFVSGP